MSQPLLSHQPPPSRVAVFRALQLGDMLCAVPALRALRAALPNAQITLIGLPWASEFAARYSSLIDDFVAFPGHPALPEQSTDTAAFPPFLRNVQRREFDLVVQLHGAGGITNPLVALFGARQLAGFYEPGSWCPDASTFVPYPDYGHEAERLLALTTALGAPDLPPVFEFPLTGDDYRDLAAVLPQQFDSRRYVVIHAGSRAAERRWSPANFARVGDELVRRGFAVVLTGSTAERSLVASVAAAMRQPALDLAGCTSLGALAALLKGARLLVSNDTGVSHLAAALRVPSVVLFSASEPARWAPPDTQLHRTFDARAASVSPQAVVDAAVSLLQPEALHA